jgi:Dolichyl-phosphate-mannose-protein mannosyltransferase
MLRFAKSVLRRAAAHPLVTIFCLALAVRLANLALLPGREAYFGESDSQIYWELGRALADPATLHSTWQSMTERMPLYPLMLAAIQAVFGDAPHVVAIIQAAIDAGTCVLVATLGALLSPTVGLVAGLVAALSPNLIVYSSQVLTDTTFTFFVALMLLAGARFMLAPTSGKALLAGLAGGLALATRPLIALMLLAAIPLVFFTAIAWRRGLRSAIAMTVLFAIACALPITPVMLRNIIHYSTVSLTSQTGEYLAYWIVPLVTERADGTPYQTTVERMQARFRQRLTEQNLSEGSPFRDSAIKSEIAREEMSRLPLKAYVRAWLEGMIVNLASPALLLDPRVRALPKPSFYNTPGQTLWDKSRAYLFDNAGLYQVLLALGLVTTAPFVLLELVGLVMLARTRPLAALLAAGVIGYFLLINGPIATPKYRLPFEPVLIVLSAIPLGRLVEWWSPPRARIT